MVSYVTGDKWNKTTITWSFAEFKYLVGFTEASYGIYEGYPDVGQYSGYITDATQQAIVKSAFAKWASVSGLTFKQITDTYNNATLSGYSDNSTAADIRIGYHKFGAGSGTLGQTFVKDTNYTLQHDTQILVEDTSETPLASDNTYSGYAASYYQVALHEIGHALGFFHNNDTSSIMYASAGDSNKDLNLTDVAGVQDAYGTKSTNIHITDNDTGNTAYLTGDTFDGPSGIPVVKQVVIGSTDEFSSIEITPHNLSMDTYVPSFIKTQDGRDYLHAHSSGLTILDGGTNTNFIIASDATNSTTVGYADQRTIGSLDTWTSFAGFKTGDEILVWGEQANNWPQFRFFDNSGAAGYTGLTMAIDHNGHTDTTTVSGYSIADLSNGRIAVSFGHTADTNGLAGSDYMMFKLT